MYSCGIPVALYFTITKFSVICILLLSDAGECGGTEGKQHAIFGEP